MSNFTIWNLHPGMLPPAVRGYRLQGGRSPIFIAPAFDHSPVLPNEVFRQLSSRRFCRSLGVRVSASPGLVFRGLGNRSGGCLSDHHDELPSLGTLHFCFTFLGQPYRGCPLQF